MKTPEQVKGSIRNIAKAKGIRSQAVLQMYLLEQLLIRIAASPYRQFYPQRWVACCVNAGVGQSDYLGYGCHG